MDNDEGYCLVLSGGGAKGVYHIGAWRALKELGVPVRAFIGNSIGAIVAGFLAQGLNEKLETLMADIGIESVFKLPEELVKDGEVKLDFEALPRIRALLHDFVSARGLDTSPLRSILASHLDEQKIRDSGIDLGIVTVNVSDLHAREVFIDAMEPGTLVDYLMASAALPGFASPVIKGKKYADGGLYDNMPYAVARKRGYRKIILIDISGLGMNRRPEMAGSQTIYIKNSIDMGGVLDFDRGFLHRFAELGYLDTMRVFGRCAGYAYFIKPDFEAETAFRAQLSGSPDAQEVALTLPSSPLFPMSMRHDRRLLLKMLECAATLLEIDRVRLYSFAELERAIAEKRALEDAKADAIISQAWSAKEGGKKGRSRHLASIVRKAIASASLADPPYFYLRLARAAVGGSTGGLIEKALATFSPELEAGMAWFDHGLRVPGGHAEPVPGIPELSHHSTPDGSQDSVPSGVHAHSGLILISECIPDILVDLRYATSDNSFGRQLYRSAQAWLLAGTAARLATAETAAHERGVRLVVLDAFRPLSAQYAMWDVMPDPDFVAPPERGSIHNRGAAVDLTLADAGGKLLPMPSDFDEFTDRASHIYSGGDPSALANRNLLRSIMESAGFRAYENEWWHYVDPELRSGPIIDFEP